MLSVEQERDMLNHSYDLLTKFCGGMAPKGNVAPFWETSREGANLLLEKGIEYGPFVAVFRQDLPIPDWAYFKRPFFHGRPLRHGPLYNYGNARPFKFLNETLSVEILNIYKDYTFNLRHM